MESSKSKAKTFISVFPQDCQKDRYAAFDPIGIPQVPEAGNQAFGFENSFTSTLNSSGANLLFERKKRMKTKNFFIKLNFFI